MPVLVVPGPDVRVRQSDEDVRCRIADAKHLVVGHVSMRPDAPGGPLGTYRPRSRDFRPRAPTPGAVVDASAYSGSRSGASGSAPLDRTAACSWSCAARSLGEYPTLSQSFDAGRVPAAQQTFLVSGGSITLPNPAAVVHIGLPYTGTLQLLPLGEDQGGIPTQMISRKVHQVTARVWQSLADNSGIILTILLNKSIDANSRRDTRFFVAIIYGRH